MSVNMDLVQRQGLGIATKLAGGITSFAGEVNSFVSGVVSDATSAIGDLTSPIATHSPSSSSAQSTSSTSSRISSTTPVSSSSTIGSTSSTSTGSTSSASRVLSSLSSSSTTSSSSSAFSLSSTITSSSSTPLITPSSSEQLETFTSGQQTITKVVSATVGPSSSATAIGATSNSFLSNKALSGFVFALCGIVGLVIILLAVTFFLRRRRNKHLLDEAISFDPASSVYQDDMERGPGEKRRNSSSSAGSYRGNSNGSQDPHNAYIQPVSVSTTAGVYSSGYNQAYDYNQQPYATYNTPAPPNPTYDGSRTAGPQIFAAMPPSQLMNPQYYDNYGPTQGTTTSPPPAIPSVEHPLPETFGNDGNHQSGTLRVANEY